MTVGTISDTIELAAGASTTIKATGENDEWIIHNIYLTDGATCDIQFGDGTNWVAVDTVTESMLSYYFHVTYDNYLRIVNQSGGTIYVGYDGVSIV